MSMEDVYKELDKVVEQKTFSLEAVKAIKELRDEYIKRTEKIKSLEESNVGLNRTINMYTVSIEENKKDIEVLKMRESRLEQREKNMIDLEKTTAIEFAKSSVWREVFEVLFKNNIMKETVVRKVTDHVVETPQQTYPGQYIHPVEKVSGRKEEMTETVTEK